MSTKNTIQQAQKHRPAIEAAVRAIAASGPLTPERVVQAAKDPKSPLHGCFLWDLKKAAQAHWYDQARELIRSVQYTFIVEDRPVAVSYFVRDPRLAGSTPGYVGIEDLKANPEWAQQHMQQELATVIDRLQRAEGYATILKLKPEMTAVRRSVQKLADRVSGPSVRAGI